MRKPATRVRPVSPRLGVVGLLVILLLFPWMARPVVTATEPVPESVPLHDCLLLFRYGEDSVIMATLTGSEARDINDAGQAVGWTVVEGALRAIRWDADGTARDLGTLGGKHSCALGINQTGQVVGWAQTAAGEPHAFRWTDGEMVDLGAEPGEHTVAFAINAAGIAVGLAWPAVPVLGGPMGRAVVWDGDESFDLGAALGTPCSGALDISTDGAIVGWVITSEADQHAFMWNAGVITDLGADFPTSSQARAINDAGVVVGWIENTTGVRTAARWEDGTLIALPAGPGRSVANDIDERGWIVGAAERADGLLHPTIWADRDLHDLGTLGGRHGEAYAINHVGQVVGWAQTASGEPRAFLWSDGVMRESSSPSPRTSQSIMTSVEQRSCLI